METPDIKNLRVILWNRLRLGYFFTIILLFYWFIFLLIGLLLPWSFQGNFFEIFLPSVSLYLTYGVFAYYIILILVIIISFIKIRALLLRDKSTSKVHYYLLSNIWVLMMFGYILTIFIIGFNNLAGVYSGIGSTIFKYIFFGAIEHTIFPEFLQYFCIIFSVVLFFSPLIIYVLGGRIDFKIEENKHLTNASHSYPRGVLFL